METIKITYGTHETQIDITTICLTNHTHNNIIKIQDGDSNRSRYFSDPVYGMLKTVFVEMDGVKTEHPHNESIEIDIINKTIKITTTEEIEEKLANIHAQLTLNYGSFHEEKPEQRMAIKYITGNEKVLEIGGNIGRNSLVIGHLLNQYKNSPSPSTPTHTPTPTPTLVTLESDPNIARQLTENRDINNMNFHIEPAALSKRKLIQRGWDTIPSEEVLPEYTPVNTITMEELNQKYNILFDTLVLDCEGAFYYILMDMPEILNNIKLIIMENDYHDIEKKNYVDNVLTQHNFYVDYTETGGWGPCYNKFFEVWVGEPTVLLRMPPTTPSL
jgi:FkbM family methyltransferase